MNWWPWDGAQEDPWFSKGESCPFSKMTHQQLNHKANVMHPSPKSLQNQLPVSASLMGSALWITLPCLILRWWSFPKQQTYKVSLGPSLQKAKRVVSRDRTSSSFWVRMATAGMDLFVNLLLRGIMSQQAVQVEIQWKQKWPTARQMLNLLQGLNNVWVLISWYNIPNKLWN